MAEKGLLKWQFQFQSVEHRLLIPGSEVTNKLAVNVMSQWAVLAQTLEKFSHLFFVRPKWTKILENHGFYRVDPHILMILTSQYAEDT